VIFILISATLATSPTVAVGPDQSHLYSKMVAGTNRAKDVFGERGTVNKIKSPVARAFTRVRKMY